MKFENVHCVNDLCASNLKFSQEDCKAVAGKANRMLGLINRIFSFKNINMILSINRFSQIPLGICSAVLVASPCNEHRKIENIQRMSPKIIPSLCNK